MIRRSLALVALCALTLSSSLIAAQQPNTSELRLVVVDETGAGIPAATVTVTPAVGEPVTFVGDDRGRATSPPLPIGQATIVVDYPGFDPVSVPVNLRRGAVNQTVTLKIAGLKEDVVVKDTTSDSTKESAATTTLTQVEIDALPDDPDDLQAQLEALAGPGGATFFMNGFRGGRLPSKDEIRAIRIRQNSFSADGHDAGRASIEIITRPSPQLAGNLNVGFKGEPLGETTEFVRGGNKEVVFNLELEFPILTAAGIKGVIFTDAGNAWNLEENYCKSSEAIRYAAIKPCFNGIDSLATLRT